MKNFRQVFYLPVLLFTILISCVPLKQYKELQERHQKCLEKEQILKRKNETFSIKIDELQSEKNKIKQRIKRLVQDSSKKAETIEELNARITGLEQQYKELRNAQNKLLEGSTQETKQLMRELQQTQENLQERQSKLRKLEESLNKKQTRLQRLQRHLENKNKRLTELEQMVHEKDSIVKNLRKTVEEALIGFKDNELGVEIKNGQIYVSLEEKLLFESGETTVNQRGIEALKKLGTILEQNPKINVMIVGHTDDVPYIPDECIKDNWDLSVMRATSVLKILLKHADIKPSRITAAGKGEYDPTVPNTSPQNKRKNRRTEIILRPDLHELFNVIGKTN